MTACCYRRARASLLPQIAPAFCEDGSELGDGSVVQLVTSSTQAQCLTDRLDCDPETAAIRALGQYLAMCERPYGGRMMAFEVVVESWPDIQDVEGGFPALAVYHPGSDSAKYDRRFGGRAKQIVGGPSGIAALHFSDWVGTLRVEAWCTSKEERIGLRLLLEQAMTPFEWLMGVRLAVPFYGGLHLEFSLLGGGFADDDDLVSKGIRAMAFDVSCSVPFWRPAELPVARPLARGSVVSGTIDADGDPVAARPLSIR